MLSRNLYDALCALFREVLDAQNKVQHVRVCFRFFLKLQHIPLKTFL